MHLYLSSRTPWNSLYTTEDGNTLYKIETPNKFVHKVTTIKRAVGNIRPVPPADDSMVSEAGVSTVKDTFGHLASIEFHQFSSSRINYQGADTPTDDFFRKEGMGPYGRNRVFTGPDGKAYKWVLGSYRSKLFTDDGSETPIARFHHGHIGVLHKHRQASLEIFPEGEHIVDLIVVTFVYIEKLRQDQVTAATATTASTVNAANTASFAAIST